MLKDPFNHKALSGLLLVMVVLAIPSLHNVQVSFLNNRVQVIITHFIESAPGGCSFLDYPIQDDFELARLSKEVITHSRDHSDDSAYRMLANATRALYLSGDRETNPLKGIDSASLSNPLTVLMVNDSHSTSENNDINSPIANWRWSGLIFLDRAYCWFDKQDSHRGFENLGLFLKVESVEQSLNGVDRIDNLYLNIKRYCTAHTTCNQDFTYFREALLSYLQVLSGSSDQRLSAKAFFRIGEVYAIDDLVASAISNYEVAVTKDPLELRYHVNLAATLGLAGRYQDAESEFTMAIERADTEQDKALVLGQLGYLYLLSQENANAVQAFEKSIGIGKWDPVYQVGLGRAYWSVGRFDDAVSTLRNVVRDYPKDDRAWVYLGIFSSEKKQWDDSIASLSRAINLAPANLDYRLELASVLVDAGRNQEAIDQYREIVNLDPQNRIAAQRLEKLLQSK